MPEIAVKGVFMSVVTLTILKSKVKTSLYSSL